MPGCRTGFFPKKKPHCVSHLAMTPGFVEHDAAPFCCLRWVSGNAAKDGGQLGEAARTAGAHRRGMAWPCCGIALLCVYISRPKYI